MFARCFGEPQPAPTEMQGLIDKIDNAGGQHVGLGPVSGRTFARR
jgi:hypothetical protein